MMVIRFTVFAGFACLFWAACSTISGHRDIPGSVNADTHHVSMPEGKINGVSLVATPKEPLDDYILELNQHQVNWVSVIPFGMSKPGGEHVYFDLPGQWWGETPEGIQTQISAAHQRGIKVLLKPQVWIIDGSFTGLFRPSNLETWFDDYLDFILLFAKVAEQQKADMFCIGTELNTVIQAAPDKWDYLISEVRKVYRGPLSYAANWDEVQQVPFWKKLDIIGVDAYYPLVHQKSPGLVELITAWRPIRDSLCQFSGRCGRPLCFTEYGYRSIEFAAGKQWELGNVWDTAPPDPELQARAYSALFQTFWPEPWFAGGFCWKWYPDDQAFEGDPSTDFTPQDKPAADTLKHYYARFSELPENNPR